MACQAQSRITSWSAKQLKILLLLMDVMATRAQDLLVVAYRQSLRRFLRRVGQRLIYMRRFHACAEPSRAMAGFTQERRKILRLYRRVFAAERLPEAALSLRAMHGMTIEAQALRDKAQLRPPRISPGIMH
jgi:hypothetical protein